MTTFSRTIDIDAPAEKVFQALCDFKHYNNWHPGMRKITGEARLGEWLVLYMTGKEKKRVVKVPVEITVLLPDQALEWQGSLFKKGRFRKTFLVRHAFLLESLADGRSRFTNEEQFYGVLSWPVSKMKAKFVDGYDAVNQALKIYCEQN